MKKFNLTKKFQGYVTKPDETNPPEDNILVAGSQNVLIDDAQKVVTRGGYELLGAANTALTPIEREFSWPTSTGTKILLRSYSDELEFYTTAIGSWEKLKDGWSAVDFSFATWWDTTEKIDKLLFVNGDDSISEWSGAISQTYASCTTNTITKTGNTWAQDRFLTAGTREVRIKDQSGTWRTFGYTGGESTQTLTGVTPDPTTYTFDVGALMTQAVRTNASEPTAGAKNDILGILNNQLYIGSFTNREVFVSKTGDFKDFSFSSPRVAGEGGLLTLDDVGVAFIPNETQMFISSGLSDWYKVEFKEITVGSTLAETVAVKKLKTGSLQGAKSQQLVGNMGDYIVFVTNEPSLRIFGDVENLANPQATIISDPIKPDFDGADFTNGALKVYKNRVCITAPGDDKMFILETRYDSAGSPSRFWQPPQILPFGALSVFGEKLYGHSNAVPESYELFTGTNDNTKQFTQIAKFAYRNYGDRAMMKNFDEWLTEGYISQNCKLMLTLDYEYKGFLQSLESLIEGADDDILLETTQSGSLGDNSLGDPSLGDGPPSDDDDTALSKFRIINEFQSADFFEIQATYQNEEIDARFELLAIGGNIRASGNQPISIKK